MALPTISEYIVELAKKIGDQYMAVKNGIGNSSTPGSALFELAQLQSLAINGIPQFGIIGSTSFQVSYSSVYPNYVSVSGGQVGYNGQIITVNTQSIPILKSYLNSYSSAYQFGMSIGFPLEEAQKASTLYATTVSTNANINDEQLLVVNASQFANLGFPLSAYVGTALLVFSSLNSTQTGFLISSSIGGRLTASFSVGTPVTFVYSPRILSLYGQPVSASNYIATNNPSAFGYYPKFPNDWLPIANVIVQNPGNPYVPNQIANGQSAIVSQIFSFPSPSTSPIFDSSDASTIVQSVSTTSQIFQSILKNVAVTQSVGALQSYTAAIANNPQVNFKQYWATSSFYPTTYFGRGVSFDQLERVQFSDSFCQAYYDLNKIDLVHTFALFRGDLYNSGAVEVGDGPSSVTITNQAATGVTSSLTNGAYAYGISAVYSNGESAPVTSTTVASSSISGFFVNEINFLPVVTPTPLYYNAYRGATSAGNQSEYQITPENLLQAGYPWVQESSPLAVENLSATYNAFKFSASSLTASSGTISLASLNFSLLTTGAISNTTDSIIVTVYTDLNGQPYAPIVTGSVGTLIPFSSLTTSPQTLTSTFTSATLTLGPTPGSSSSSSSGSSGSSSKYYWAVISFTNSPIGGTIQTQCYLKNTSQFLTSPNESVWSGGLDSWVQPVSGTSGLTWTPYIYTTPSQSFPITGSNYLAVKFTAATSTPGVTNGQIQIGGIELMLSSTANLTNLATDGLNVTLYSNNAGVPGSTLGVGTLIHYSNITTTMQPYISLIDATVTVGNSYWAVVTATTSPLGGLLSIASFSASSNTYANSVNGISWTVSGYNPWIQPLGFLDNGRTGLFQTSRGLRLTGEIALTPTQLSVFVPTITGLTTTPSYTGPAPTTGDTTLTKNDMVVTVVAQNGTNGIPTTLTTTVPAGTSENTRFSLGTSSQVFDRVNSVTVVPGTNLVIGSGGSIIWDIYDFITVESVP